MTTPRPTRIEVTSGEVAVTTDVLEVAVNSVVEERVLVTTATLDQTVVQTEIVEAI